MEAFLGKKIQERKLICDVWIYLSLLHILDNLGAVLSDYDEYKSLFNGRSLEETARFILSTATSTSSSVTVNYFIPLLLLSSK